MRRKPAHRSHLLTAMVLSLVIVGAMCVFVAATSGLHIETEFLEIHLGPDHGTQVSAEPAPIEGAQTGVSPEATTEDDSANPLNIVDEATDLLDEAMCPTDSVCLSGVLKDSGLDQTVDELSDGLPGSSLGDTVGETAGDALEAETLGDTVDEVVEDVDESADSLLDDVEDVVEDLVDEVEDTVDDVLGGLGLGN